MRNNLQLHHLFIILFILSLSAITGCGGGSVATPENTTTTNAASTTSTTIAAATTTTITATTATTTTITTAAATTTTAVSTTTTTLAPAFDALKYFNTTCLGCHGNLGVRTAAQIQAAINSHSQMAALGLTSSQIAAIAAVSH